MLFYKHEQCIVPDNCNKYGKKKTFFEISQHSNLIKKNGHNYTNLEHSQILFLMQQWMMVPDHGTSMKKIHPAIMEKFARTDRRTRPLSHVIQVSNVDFYLFHYQNNRSPHFFTPLSFYLSLRDLGLLQIPW